jgi:hypothetical protein
LSKALDGEVLIGQLGNAAQRGEFQHCPERVDPRSSSDPKMKRSIAIEGALRRHQDKPNFVWVDNGHARTSGHADRTTYMAE